MNLSTENITDSNDSDVEDVPFKVRFRRNPVPGLIWVSGVIFLLILEGGALLHFLMTVLKTIVLQLPNHPFISGIQGGLQWTANLPTLLSRHLIANQGYWNGNHWVNTFHIFDWFYLSPAWAWFLRVVLVYLYAFAFLYWVGWRGYKTYRQHYRYADWTPLDDQIDRFSTHRWGQFGFLMAFAFFVMAMFAPTLSPTTLEQNILHSYSSYTKYWAESANEVRRILIGQANLQTGSEGTLRRNVAPLSYDQFGRWHPFGTMPSGTDLFMFMMYGARISLFISLGAMIIAGFIAASLALSTAYFKGLFDLAVVVTSDSVQSLPFLMIVIAASYLFQDTWIAQIYSGAILLMLLFGIIYWPYLWRSIRGPALQVAEETWIDAAKSYGQSPTNSMQKHMFPYVIGYLLVYGSMSLAGVIVSVSALSYLGLGITPPTPEWGRAISVGQPYVSTVSWHIATIPGIMITLVATGFNALGDGIRDAIDPQSEGGEGEQTVAAGGGA
ncbi:MAG: ABC transporter permease [Halobacteriaceae archaeon]